VIAIIGKSGSGKSTLLRCINGLEEFQHGALTVDGAAAEARRCPRRCARCASTWA
jgi:ABC-type polar amino acid transport system ATPase subunit